MGESGGGRTCSLILHDRVCLTSNSSYLFAFLYSQQSSAFKKIKCCCDCGVYGDFYQGQVMGPHFLAGGPCYEFLIKEFASCRDVSINWDV